MIRRMRRALSVGALLAASSLAAAMPAQAAPSTDDARSPRTAAVRGEAGVQVDWFELKNKANGDCLYASASTSSVLADGYCGMYNDSLWAMDSQSDGSVRLRNYTSGRCAYGAGTANNSYVKQWTCGNYADQKWDVLMDPDQNHFRLKNRNSGKCLLHRFADYGPAQVYTCGSYADQRWSLQ